jgi:predicted SnoaL-like aldol condensation-catalyzing enzyme
MRTLFSLLILSLALTAANAEAADCRLKPKEVVTRFMTQFYVDKKVREAFETWARIIADGNLVAVHSHGKFAADDRGVAVVDILRVEGCKVMEHWDVVQPVPEKSANSNGMF